MRYALAEQKNNERNSLSMNVLAANVGYKDRPLRMAAAEYRHVAHLLEALHLLWSFIFRVLSSIIPIMQRLDQSGFTGVLPYHPKRDSVR